jgi:hypothetical protein
VTGLLKNVPLIPPGRGSAKINETKVTSTKKLAKSAVVISFIEASPPLASQIYLLDL